MWDSTPTKAIIQDVIPTGIITRPTVTPKPLPTTHIIPQKKHMFQSFNNCGPATLSMALSYVGVDKSQEELGAQLRPYQVVGGDNDDKSVTLQEVANQARTYGLHSYLRPNGSIETLKKLLSQDIVVVTRTWLEPNEDIGHYRIIRGYDDSASTLIQDDSFQGKDLSYSYDEFNSLWVPFNYEYLVIVDESKKEIVENILGEDLNESTAWRNALSANSEALAKDPTNIHLRFARSRIYYYLKDYRKSVEEFDAVENQLSFRTLWYQIEPLYSIYETGDYDRVLLTSDRILNNQNRAYTELYILRGDIYQKQGQSELAVVEYQKGLEYNKNNREIRKRIST